MLRMGQVLNWIVYFLTLPFNLFLLRILSKLVVVSRGLLRITMGLCRVVVWLGCLARTPPQCLHDRGMVEVRAGGRGAVRRGVSRKSVM